MIVLNLSFDHLTNLLQYCLKIIHFAGIPLVIFKNWIFSKVKANCIKLLNSKFYWHLPINEPKNVLHSPWTPIYSQNLKVIPILSKSLDSYYWIIKGQWTKITITGKHLCTHTSSAYLSKPEHVCVCVYVCVCMCVLLCVCVCMLVCACICVCVLPFSHL